MSMSFSVLKTSTGVLVSARDKFGPWECTPFHLIDAGFIGGRTDETGLGSIGIGTVLVGWFGTIGCGIRVGVSALWSEATGPCGPGAE